MKAMALQDDRGHELLRNPLCVRIAAFFKLASNMQPCCRPSRRYQADWKSLAFAQSRQLPRHSGFSTDCCDLSQCCAIILVGARKAEVREENFASQGSTGILAKPIPSNRDNGVEIFLSLGLTVEV